LEQAAPSAAGEPLVSGEWDLIATDRGEAPPRILAHVHGGARDGKPCTETSRDGHLFAEFVALGAPPCGA